MDKDNTFVGPHQVSSWVEDYRYYRKQHMLNAIELRNQVVKGDSLDLAAGDDEWKPRKYAEERLETQG